LNSPLSPVEISEKSPKLRTNQVTDSRSMILRVLSVPLMILLGLSIFALSLGAIGMVWIDHYRDLLATFG